MIDILCLAVIGFKNKASQIPQSIKPDDKVEAVLSLQCQVNGNRE